MPANDVGKVEFLCLEAAAMVNAHGECAERTLGSDAVDVRA